MKAKHILILLVVLLAAGPAWAPDSFVDGLASFNAGEWEPAASQLAAAARLRPSDSVVRMTAGVALAHLKRYQEAADQFSAAAKLPTDGVLPYLLLDGVYGEMGKAAESKRARDAASSLLNSGRAFNTGTSSDRVLIKSLARYPQNAIGHCLLGDMYQMQNKLALAREHYEKASKLAPKWVKPVFNMGMANLQTDPKAAEDQFGQVIQMDPSNRHAYLWKGEALLQQNDVGQAITFYSEAAKDKSLAPEARTRIGNAQLRAGNYAAAKKEFDVAAKQAPQDPRPIAGRAQALQNDGKLAEAELNYQQAAEVSVKNSVPAPSQSVIQNNLADVQMQQGKLSDANSNFALGFELNPTPANADTLASNQMRVNVLPGEIAKRESALAKNPKDMPSMLYLLSAYRLSGNVIGRIQMAQRLLKRDPSNAPHYYAEIGAAQMSQGNATEAVDAYVKALDSGNAASWATTAQLAAQSGALKALSDKVEASFKATRKATRGLMLFELQSEQRDAEGMIATAETLIKLNPDQQSYWLRLGEAYELAGNTGLAITAYSKASSGPSPEASAAARARVEALGK